MLTYKEHYQLSVKNYGLQNIDINNLYNFTAFEVQAGSKNKFVVFDQEYFDCIQKLSDISNTFFSSLSIDKSLTINITKIYLFFDLKQ